LEGIAARIKQRQKESIMKDRAGIAALFEKHCRKCETFICCKVGEINLFERDIALLPDIGGVIRSDSYVSMPFGKTCRFLGNAGCCLDLSSRPLDCMTFPVYPLLEYAGGEGFHITGMFVSRMCPLAGEISKDSGLIADVKYFWETETADLTASEMNNWFQDSAGFWSEENIIRCGGKPIGL